MDHESRLQLLGLTTAVSHQLELVTAQILARALKVSESTARLVSSAMGVGSALGVMQTLTIRRESGSLEPRALRSWLNLAKSANEARNRVIHTPWVDPFDGPALVLAKGSMKLESRTEEDLRADIEAIRIAVRDGYQLLGQ